MGDFFQNRGITTLHKFAGSDQHLEDELIEISRSRPIGLVLPALYSEFQGPALENIVSELAKVPYLTEIVVGLDRANFDQFLHAKSFLSRLPQRTRIVWNDGPRMQAIASKLKDLELAPKEKGKGCNVWYCFGYVLASDRADVIAMHDCDILTYNRFTLARMVYPIANPLFNFRFCKGYYYRSDGEKLNGRVCRLLIGPLIRALKQVFGNDPYLDYIASFRYALAGECASRRDVIMDLRMPNDWGLEVGIASAMYRELSAKQVCQVEIAEAYDHKHQELSIDNPSKGLSKMSMDIALAFYRKIASSSGKTINKATIRTIREAYYEIALEFIEKYYYDSLINDLKLDRHAEEEAVELFASNVLKAGETFLEQGDDTQFIPSWRRVRSASRGIFKEVIEAVEQDNIDACKALDLKIENHSNLQIEITQ